MKITIPSTGKPCIKCKERDGNPLHDGVCNVCYSNELLGVPKVEIINNTQSKFPKSEPNVWETRAVWILVGIFIVIGILFLSKTSNNEIQDQDYCDGSRNAYC